jgi:tetratricopeptide (TPR) repeat protein
MIRPTMVIAVLFSLSRTGAAQSIDQAKLREAIKLPEMSVEFNFKFNARNDDASQDPNAQIAAMQKTLRGDPSDAEIYIKIGNIYNAEPVNDQKQAAVVYKKAIPLFRKQLEKEPKNAWVMAQLGTGLADLGQDEAAEKMLQEAVRLAPKDWRIWVELGRYQQQRALSPLGLGKAYPADVNEITNDAAVVTQRLQAIQSQNAPPEQIAQMQKDVNEAQADFDRAVSLNPGAPEPYEARAAFYIGARIFTQSLIDTAQGKKPDDSLPLLGKMVADLWKAADVAPNDPARQWMAALMEITRTPAGVSGDLDPAKPGGIDRMPVASRQRIHTALDRLSKTADDKDAHKAVVAATGLIWFHYANGDAAQMEKWSKRVLTIDPNNVNGWRALSLAYLYSKRYKEFEVALQDRLKREDTPFNRLMLAKIYRELSEDALASNAVSAGVQRFPNDLLLNLAVVDVLLKRPDANALKQADAPMAHAQELFAKMSAEDQKVNRSNLNLTRTAYLARNGKVSVAKQVLQNVLNDDADNKNAKDLMAVMGGSP